MKKDSKWLTARLGKTRGHFSSKANRIAKLIEIWPHLEIKMDSFIKRGLGSTEHARLAYGTLLMMYTGIRVGNESSAEGWICENQIICRKANKEKGLKVGDVIWQHPLYGQHVQTFGLTTLLNRHIKRRTKRIEISFTGKKLVDQTLIVRHPTLVKFCPKDKLDKPFLNVDYQTFKKFVKKYIGKNYTPKDLRMAKANLVFIEKFGFDPCKTDFANATTKSARKKILADAIAETAAIIGHTNSVCRSAYLSQPLLASILET